MDDSIMPETGDTDDDGSLPVEIATLEIDGVRPAVGDSVSLKVKGSITKIVDQTAWIQPETVNDQPIPQELPDASEDDLMKSAAAHDMAGTAY